jgi:thiol reductant ABC exporter CydD subunit
VRLSRDPGSRLRDRRNLIDRRVLRDVAGARLAVGVSVTCGLVSAATIVVQAAVLAKLLAGAFGDGRHGNREVLLVWFGGAVVVRACSAIVTELAANLAASSSKARLRSLLARAVLERSAHAGAGGAGDVATLAGRGLDALDVYVGRCIPDLVLAAAAPIALVIAVGAFDWLSALVLLCLVALFPVFGVLVGRSGTRLASQRWRQVRELGDHLLDLFEGLPVLKAFGRSADQRARVRAAGEALREASIATLRVAFLSALVLDTLASVSVALVAVPLGLRLLDGSMGLAPALAVLVIAPEVFVPLRRASAEFHESSEGLAAAADAYSRIDGVTLPGPRDAATVPPRKNAPDPRLVPLAVSSVCCSFPGSSQTVLEDCTFAVAPGETIAVVGPTGAGKSTLLTVVLGLLVPSSGTVRVGGRDLDDLEPASWRARLAYLPDRPALIGASLADNLRLAKPDAGDDKLVTALVTVGAAGMLGSMPGGLEALVGEGGRPVSAGERQCIGLARIMLHDASLYLLDEPTAHLDPDTEEKVIQALRVRLADRSAIVVTHSSAPLALARRIFTLREGRIVQPHGLEAEQPFSPVSA